MNKNKPQYSSSALLQSGVVALRERYLRHVKAPVRPQGERTVQLSIIRKDSTSSGQEELHTESVTVTVKEGEDEPVLTKPGKNTCTGQGVGSRGQEATQALCEMTMTNLPCSFM